MSTALAVLNDNYSIVATDSRATYHEIRDGAYWSDDCEKIFLSKFGWVASFGGIELTKLYIQELLESHDIKSRHHIYTCYLLALRKTESAIFPFMKDKELTKSGTPKCMLSIRFIYGLNYFKTGKLNMSVETVDVWFKHRKLIQKNELVIFPPKETRRTERLIEKYTSLSRIANDVHENIYLIACFIQELSKLSKLVNNIVNCGITLKLSENEIVFLKVTENAKDIKKLYEESKDLSTIMYVVGGVPNDKIQR